MDKDFLITIITTIYNGEKYVGRYLESILDQSYKGKIEIIIVDDGSTDLTGEIVKSYLKKLRKKGYFLNYIKQNNKGLGHATSVALNVMHGAYFLWCNVDDYYRSDTLDFLAKAVESYPSYSCIRFNGIVYSKDRKIFYKMASSIEYQEGNQLLLNAILERNFHFGCSLVKKKDFYEFNSHSYDIYPSRYGQNWQILLPIFYKGKTKYFDETFFYFLVREDSISSRWNSSYEQSLMTINEHEKILFNTLCKMKCDDYDEIVKVKYAIKRIHLYSKYRKYRLCRAEYKKIRSVPKDTLELFNIPKYFYNSSYLGHFLERLVKIINH